MVKKVIQVALAFLLVFFVAAPLIVGVYDASNLRTNRTTEPALGTLVTKSELQGWGGYSYPSDNSFGDAAGYIQQSNNTLSETPTGKEAVTLTDWYSGNTDIDNSLRSGDVHLVYEFADGSVVDFGNPYIGDWTDVSAPYDYYEVVSSVDTSLLSFLEPEKAHAGPLGFALNKLNYLVVKSGFYKKFGSLFYSAFVYLAMSTGMSAPAATNAYNAFMQRVPAITQTITSENAAWSTEGTAMMTMNSLLRTAARKPTVAEFPAALNTEIAANIASVESTGMLLGGGTGNFVNVLYQMATTAGLPASLVYSDFALYLGSWLGGQFDDYFDDVPTIGEVSDVFNYSLDGVLVPPIRFSDHVNFGYGVDFANSYRNASSTYPFSNLPDNCLPQLNAGFQVDVFNNQYYLTLPGYNSETNRPAFIINKSPTVLDYISPSWDELYSAASYDYIIKSGTDILVKNTDRYTDRGLVNPNLPSEFYLYKDGVWNTDLGSLQDSPTGEVSIAQVIGADAEFDADGNLINAGNLNVPDITAPGYIQPGSFSEALDQMQSTATIEKPAQSTSPTIGNSSTVGDWINQNKPTTPDPSEESSQNDFKIQDLEKVFPFCIPWDLYYLLAIFTANPVAPNFNWHFNFAMAGEYDFYVDLSSFDAVAQVCRACETVLFCVGLALVTRNLIRG